MVTLYAEYCGVTSNAKPKRVHWGSYGSKARKKYCELGVRISHRMLHKLIIEIV